MTKLNFTDAFGLKSALGSVPFAGEFPFQKIVLAISPWVLGIPKTDPAAESKEASAPHQVGPSGALHLGPMRGKQAC